MASSGINSNSNANTNSNAGFNFSNSMNHLIDFNAKIEQVLDSDENLEDNNDFIDLLGLDDWEQMLDEDCISRLTADFNNNNIMNVSSSTSKPLVSTPINSTNSNIVQPSLVAENQEKISANTTTSTTMPKIQYITNTKSQSQTKNNSQPLVLRVPSQQQQTNVNQSYNNNSNSNTNIKKINIHTENSTTANNNHNNSSLNIITNTKPNLPTSIISNATASVVRRLSSVMLNENKKNNNNTTTYGQNHGTTTSVTATKSIQSLTSVISNKNTNVRSKQRKAFLFFKRVTF